MTSNIDLIDQSAFLTEEHKIKIRESVKRIMKSRKIYEFVESLRLPILYGDIATREAGLNELSAVVLQLPPTILTPDVGNFLLSFLLPRVEDSGHVAAEFLVATIMHLARCCGKELNYPIIGRMIGILYETNGVQSYAQGDRMTLFELLHYLFIHFGDDIPTIYNISTIIAAFIRSANSERDPRCLLKIFEIHIFISRHYALGHLVEDLFDLIACYYPIDYEPRESDVAKITSAMLSAGCEACLMANMEYGSFCFQVIADKLLDRDASTSAAAGDGAKLRLRQQLDVCQLLCKACTAFSSPVIVDEAAEGLPLTNFVKRTELEDFMTAFRLIALNPVAQQREMATEVRHRLADAATALTAYLTTVEQDSGRREEQLKFMATNSLENCEPFVLQAEMGLTGQALLVLEVLVNANPMAAQLILPKVLYWFNVLLTGMTLKSLTNRQEVCEECLEFLPTWFQLAADSHTAGYLTTEATCKLYYDIFDAIDGVAPFCAPSKQLRAMCDCVKLAGSTVLTGGTDGRSAFDRRLSALINDIVNVAENYGLFVANNEGEAELAVKSVLSLIDEMLTVDNPDECYWLVKRLRESSNAEWTVAVRLFIVSIHDGPSADEILSPIFQRIDRELKCDDLTRPFTWLIELAKNLSHSEEDIYAKFESQLFELLPKIAEHSQATLENLTDFFQSLGLELIERQRDQLIVFLLDYLQMVSEGPKSVFHTMWCAISPLIQQSKTLAYSNRFVDFTDRRTLFNDVLLPNFKRVLLGVLFAVTIRMKTMLHEHQENRLFIRRTIRRICHCPGVRDPYSGQSIENAVRSYLNCECGGWLTCQVVAAQAKLLIDPKMGIGLVSVVFNNYQETGSCEGIENLLDFSWHRNNPDYCTPLWRQRVLCQFVPTYIAYFEQIPEDNVAMRAGFLRLLSPIFQFAQTIGRPTHHQLKMLTPVITQAFQLIFSSDSTTPPAAVAIDKRQILDATVELLRAVQSVDELGGEALNLFLTVYAKELLNDNNPQDIIFSCLKGLRLLVRKCGQSPTIIEQLRAHYLRIVQGTTRMSQSTLRPVRQYAAEVRNTAEILRSLGLFNNATAQ